MKAIKYIISLGFIVVGAIIIGICAPHVDSISELGFVFGEGDKSDFTPEITAEEAQSITRVSINSDLTNVKIEKGDTLSVTCKDIVREDFELEIENGELEIEYDNEGIIVFGFSSEDDGEIVVTLPEKLYNEISIDHGVGTLTVSDVSCEVFDLDCGVGESTLSNVTAKSLDVDMGVGKCVVRDSLIGNCKVEGGVGRFTINNSDITSGATIDGGVGEISINLNSDNYSVSADSGIGDVVFNGDEVEGNSGRGSILIDADCGIGDININTGLRDN